MGTTKELVRKGLFSIGYKLIKTPPPNKIQSKLEIIENFKSSGQVPWSFGYNEFKEEKILSVLNERTIMQKFSEADKLPDQFGVGLDERIIEYPWFFSQAENFSLQKFRYLDAGPVMNHKFIVDRARKLAKKVHFTTLSHEENCYHELDISYLFEDLVKLPIKNDFYDLISCISTLEHVGCDNRCYDSQGESSPENQKNYTYLEAASELSRVLKPGGSLYLTIPYGRYMHLGMLQQFDGEMLERLCEVFTGSVVYSNFYKYTNSGWKKSDQESCKDAIFVEWLASSLMNQAYPEPHPIEKDKAAAARAICCIKINKK